MARSTQQDQCATRCSDTGRNYVVIARRYRPQTFDDLIGQEHVAQALRNAISGDRVGHAYLFTGARGVGKTSAARILAKALNCVDGPSPSPCNRCELCQAISAGADVDVLEIDGASNRGIDEIRELRQNVSVRPSRARYKIYIIDEVHMLTREAFNALLKTLEEPPGHVKFIFCTTEPGKIPVTILSRCQRFDFAGIQTASIVRRLAQIVEAEGVEAETAALELLARRAAGSMRDSQSLLEQLLAFAAERITVETVHAMLGTAGDEMLVELAGRLTDRDAAAALEHLDRALAEGVDVSQLIEQLLSVFRDLMVAAAGCQADNLLCAEPDCAARLVELGRRWGLATILAAMQILDHALGRMRYSTQPRLLAELALVQICRLDELDELPAWLERLDAAPSSAATGSSRGSTSGAPASAPASSGRPRGPSPGASPPRHGPSGSATGEATHGRHSAGRTLTSSPGDRPGAPGGNGASRSTGAGRDGLGAAPNLEADADPEIVTEAAADPAVPIGRPGNPAEVWLAAVGRVGGIAAEPARQFDHATWDGPDRLVVVFRSGYVVAKAFCERPDQAPRFERAVREVVGREVSVEFRASDAHEAAAPELLAPQPTNPQQRLRELAKHPLLRRAADLFGAVPVRVEPGPRG